MNKMDIETIRLSAGTVEGFLNRDGYCLRVLGSYDEVFTFLDENAPTFLDYADVPQVCGAYDE